MRWPCTFGELAAKCRMPGTVRQFRKEPCRISKYPSKGLRVEVLLSQYAQEHSEGNFCSRKDFYALQGQKTQAARH